MLFFFFCHFGEPALWREKWRRVSNRVSLFLLSEAFPDCSLWAGSWKPLKSVSVSLSLPLPFSGLIAVMPLSQTEGALILTATGADTTDCSHCDLSVVQENNRVSRVWRCVVLRLQCALCLSTLFFIHIHSLSSWSSLFSSGSITKTQNVLFTWRKNNPFTALTVHSADYLMYYSVTVIIYLPLSHPLSLRPFGLLYNSTEVKDSSTFFSSTVLQLTSSPPIVVPSNSDCKILNCTRVS